MTMDDKSKKQLKIILFLAPVMLLVLGKNLVGPMFSRQKAAPPATTAAAVVRPAAKAAAGTEPQIFAPPGRDEAVRALEERPWGRNPFQVEKRAAAPTAAKPSGDPKIPQNAQTKAPLFKLEGIVWDDTSPYAVINGELRVVGDRIFAYEIVEIKRDRVTLRKDGQNIDLRLFPDMR